jgi:thiamine biosynthesis lipoprotein
MNMKFNFNFKILAGRPGSVNGSRVLRATLVPFAVLAGATATPLSVAASAAPESGGGITRSAREARLVMGTLAEVVVEGVAETNPALDAAFAALDDVDRRMSLWKPSELSALNERGAGELSPPLFAVLDRSLEIARASHGAFDPTVEPLVRAAGGMGGPRRALDAAERRRLLARVGWSRIRLDASRRTIDLAGTSVDLGGIAKGYAVDEALAALRALGARAAVVDLGRSSVGSFGRPLVLDIADPERTDAPAWGTFALEDASVGSSGGDQHKDHILDPRTGRAAHRVLGTTLVAPSAIDADGLSTAVYVLGADEGLALLEARGLAGFVLVREKGRPVIHTTRGFATAHDLRAAAGVGVRP